MCGISTKINDFYAISICTCKCIDPLHLFQMVGKMHCSLKKLNHSNYIEGDQYWKINIFLFYKIGHYASIHDQVITFLTNLNETFDLKRAVILLFIIQIGHQHALNRSYLLKMHGGLKFQAPYCFKEDGLCMSIKHKLGA